MGLWVVCLDDDEEESTLFVFDDISGDVDCPTCNNIVDDWFEFEIVDADDDDDDGDDDDELPVFNIDWVDDDDNDPLLPPLLTPPDDDDDVFVLVILIFKPEFDCLIVNCESR